MLYTSDSFNRANTNTSLGSTDAAYGGTSVPWQQSGHLGIEDGQLRGYSTLTSYRYGYVNVGSPVQTCVAKVTNRPTQNDGGVMVNYVDTGNNYGLYYGANNLYLARRMANSSVTLGSWSYVLANGDVLMLSRDPSTGAMDCYVNNQRLNDSPIVDTQLASSAMLGIRSPFNGVNFRADDFYAHDVPPISAIELHSGTLLTQQESTLTSVSRLTVGDTATRSEESSLVLSGGGPHFFGSIDLSAASTLSRTGSPAMGGTLALAPENAQSRSATIRTGGSLDLSQSVTGAYSASRAGAGELNFTNQPTIFMAGYAGPTGTLELGGAASTLERAGGPALRDTLALAPESSLALQGTPRFVSVLDTTTTTQQSGDAAGMAAAGELYLLLDSALGLAGFDSSPAPAGIEAIMGDGTRLSGFILGADGEFRPIQPVFT